MIVTGVGHGHGGVPVPERGHDHGDDHNHGNGHAETTLSGRRFPSRPTQKPDEPSAVRVFA